MILSFEIIMKNQRHKGILKLSLNSQPLVGKIFIFTTKITINTKYRSFQCKILNVFYLNKILFKFENLKSHFARFLSQRRKQLHTYLANVYVHNIYGIKPRSSFQAIVLSLRIHRRVPFFASQTPVMDTFY